MKYFRTKDGIMKIDFEIETELSTTISVHTEECVIGEYEGIEVIKQADTIEELCDEFVAMKPNNLWRILSAKDYLNGFKDEMNESYEEGYQVYGAIWTDKGLIYVAKMNGKGELELL